MPNSIKFNDNEGAETLALNKGNFYIGTGDVGKGPTSTTGYFNGITPPNGGYTIYLNKASQGPSIYTAANDAGLITVTNLIASENFTTAAQCFEYFAGQSDKMVFNSDYPAIVTNGLMLNLDAGFTPSYPRTGATWYDISSNGNNGALTNGPTFTSANSGSIVWDGSDDYCDIGKTASQLGFYDANYTMEAWVYPTSLTNDRTMFGTDQLGLRLGLHLVFRSGAIYQGHYASDFSAGTVTVNNWYQIVYTYNASNGACQIFKNNVSQGTGTILSFIGTTNILIARWAGNYNFQGDGGIYRIYNRVLSLSEISQNYNSTKSRFGL